MGRPESALDTQTECSVGLIPFVFEHALHEGISGLLNGSGFTFSPGPLNSFNIIITIIGFITITITITIVITITIIIAIVIIIFKVFGASRAA